MGQKLGVKDYTDASVQAALKDEEMTKAIKEGVKDKEGKTLMKPAEGLSDADVKGLVTLVRFCKEICVSGFLFWFLSLQYPEF